MNNRMAFILNKTTILTIFQECDHKSFKYVFWSPLFTRLQSRCKEILSPSNFFDVTKQQLSTSSFLMCTSQSNFSKKNSDVARKWIKYFYHQQHQLQAYFNVHSQPAVKHMNDNLSYRLWQYEISPYHEDYFLLMTRIKCATL